MNVMNVFRKVIYVLAWSIGLFVSTFFSCVAKWDFQDLFDGEDVVIGVMMPIIVVMALYLWEEVVNIDTMNNIPASSLKLQLKWTLLSLSVSILCIGLIGVTTNGWRLLFLILSWLSISCVKFISMYFSNSEIKIVEVV